METTTFLTTERLELAPLFLSDDSFILELVNTQGWLEFIGNRNIHSLEDAQAYIHKIENNVNATYWKVCLKEAQTPIGIITFIKREYLQQHDIGFAFLPRFGNKGYAFEAANAVLNQLRLSDFTRILAMTMPQNTSSIRLLERLGLQFVREIDIEKEILHLYSIALEKDN
jgi:[ribosomal protein S5]-alanine N-acetyltransferase